MSAENMVLIDRGVLAAAVYAIVNKLDAPKTVEAIRDVYLAAHQAPAPAAAVDRQAMAKECKRLALMYAEARCDHLINGGSDGYVFATRTAIYNYIDALAAAQPAATVPLTEEPTYADLLSDNGKLRKALHFALSRDPADAVLCEQVDRPKWISVEERMPELGVRVIVSDGAMIDFDFMNEHGWDNDWSGLHPYTHWMDTPAPPSGEKGSEG